MNSESEQVAELGGAAATVAEATAAGDRDVLAGLNDSQRAAVTHLGGPLLIVAGAGSGKTRTLTRRFEWLVRNGVPAERILALTYTGDAATELAERIDAALGEHVDETSAATFHSMCMNLLRDEAAAARLNPFFTTATGPDRVAIMLARLNEISFDRLALRGNPAAVIGELLELIDRLKEECAGPEELRRYADAALADAADPDARERAELLAEQAEFYALHERFLRDAGALDFGGMQFEAYKLLAGDEAVRRRIARRWDHVLVDEFQDTSYVQLEILRLLCMDHRNLAAVGDDDQSIYRFRGASPRSIVNFGERFGEHTRVELELNYRSAPAIINAARGVIGVIDSERRVDKKLTAAHEKSGDVLFWHCASEVAEAQAIVGEIEHLIVDGVAEPRDICVLVAKRAHAATLADRLAAHRIPFLLESRDFFRRSEIRIPLSWLKVLANPLLNEDAWRLLSASPVGLDSAELAALMRWMSKDKQPNVVAAARSAARGRQFSPESLDKLRGFVRLYDELSAGLDELGPGAFVIGLINRIALKGTLVLHGGDNNPDRLANIAKFQEMAEQFATRRAQATAREFALYVTAMSEAGFDEPSATAENDPNSVRVMTAHGAKGLEFEYVFMPGMVAARWPGKRGADLNAMPEALIHDQPPDPPGKDPRRLRHIEDQRRLAHVAMTRARTRLVMSRFDSDKRGYGPSPFYDEALTLIGGDEVTFAERDFDPSDFVFAELEALRGDLMRAVDDAGAGLVEMRLDAHAGTPADFARFAELIKLSALSHRVRHGQTIAEALPEINSMLAGSMSPAQRAEFESSELDERLLAGERYSEKLDRSIASLTPQLGSYVPVVGDRLRLSASDITTYQRCPKMYEFEKVMRVPTREKSHLRLGILVHNVLERYHRDLGDRRPDVDESRRELERLLEAGIATGGWGGSDDDRQLLDRARAMLRRYAENELAHPDGPVDTEIKFSLKLPPSPAMAQTPLAGRKLAGIQINGKIDRIDRRAGGDRLIDYKTGKKREPRELRDDVQLAIYRIAAEETLGIEASSLIYFYLEHENPAVAAEAGDERIAEVRETINAVADHIVRLEFDATPSPRICKDCAFGRVCPATEA